MASGLPKGRQDSPTCVQDGPGCPQDYPRWPRDCRRASLDGPRGLQENVQQGARRHKSLIVLRC
eukprot:517249-Pyramimonas_sp.AAC.1